MTGPAERARLAEQIKQRHNRVPINGTATMFQCGFDWLSWPCDAVALLARLAALEAVASAAREYAATWTGGVFNPAYRDSLTAALRALDGTE